MDVRRIINKALEKQGISQETISEGMKKALLEIERQIDKQHENEVHFAKNP